MFTLRDGGGRSRNGFGREKYRRNEGGLLADQRSDWPHNTTDPHSSVVWIVLPATATTNWPAYERSPKSVNLNRNLIEYLHDLDG